MRGLPDATCGARYRARSAPTTPSSGTPRPCPGSLLRALHRLVDQQRGLGARRVEPALEAVVHAGLDVGLAALVDGLAQLGVHLGVVHLLHAAVDVLDRELVRVLARGAAVGGA